MSTVLSHFLTNGYLTWEWDKAIRGYTHPLIFAIFYKFLQLLNVDYAWAVVSYTAQAFSLYMMLPLAQAEGPKLLQALPAVVSDVYVYKLAQRLFGPSCAQYAVST